MLSSARVVNLLRDGGGGMDGGDRAPVVGVRVADLTDGSSYDVRARSVVAATGVWSDDIGAMLGDSAPSLRVRASKGVHVVVPRSAIDGPDLSPSGLILRTTTSVLFVIPWGEHWIIGTTDTPWTLDRAHPAASSADIAYLLDQVNRVLTRPVSADSILGVYAGLRPLLHGESDETSRLSREHAVVTPVPGLVLVAGGKYTTYRVMAEDAVDAAAAVLPGVPGSRTAHLPLVGARDWTTIRDRAAEIATEADLPGGGDPTVAAPARGPDRRRPRPGPPRSRAPASARRGTGLPRRGGGARRRRRGRSAPRRRPDPPDAGVDRDRRTAAWSRHRRSPP